MPTKVLNFKTPLQHLKDFFPTIRLFSELPLKIFGCTAYVHQTLFSQSKLDPRAIKCFDPLTNKYFESMDVENQSFFNPTSLQGESSSLLEENFWDTSPLPNIISPEIMSSSPLIPKVKNSPTGGETLQTDLTGRNPELQFYTRRNITQRDRNQTIELT